MANTIKIKRSATLGTTDPTGLAAGELAWLNMAANGPNGKLFIGSSDGSPTVRHIGGVGAGAVSGYTHPTHDGDDISLDTTALTGAVVISDLDFNVTTDSLGHVTDANGAIATRTLTLANLGYTGSADANTYVLPTDLAGDDIDVDTTALTGAVVLSDLDLNITTNTSGLVTDANCTIATRTLTLANLGYTGETNATADQSSSEIVGLLDNEATYSLGDASSGTITVNNDLTVTGDLLISGDTVTTNTATLTVEDPLIILSSGNAADTVDTGFYSKYVVGVTSKWAGVIRDASTAGDPWTFFDSLTTEPTTTVTVGSNNFAYAAISCGQIKSDGAISGTSFTGAGTGLTGTGASFTAGAVSTIAGLAPNTATTQATQGSITSIANLATVGEITSGTWSATALIAAKVPAITALTGYTAAAYANASSVGTTSIVTVGALTGGSIASGFTSISTSYTDAKCTVAAADQTSANSAAGLTGTPSITVATATTTGSIQLGHASDTTITRDSGGVVSIEGNVVIVDDSTIDCGTY